VPPGPVVSVSVDLDPIECYFRIHALPGPPPESARFAILRRCLPRFRELFARHGVKATFFVVGRDLDEDPEGRRLLAELAAAGHELANHSYAHPYDLTRLPRPRMAEEIDRSHGAIAACAGAAPVGFRAPGYETSHVLLDLLGERGYAYDSSAFPSVPYYLAKAAVMASLRLRRRKSGSILGSPAILRAPRAPYHPSATDAYRAGDRADSRAAHGGDPLAAAAGDRDLADHGAGLAAAASGERGAEESLLQPRVARDRPVGRRRRWVAAGADRPPAGSAALAGAEAGGAGRHLARGARGGGDLEDFARGRGREAGATSARRRPWE
jgi:hypothetical protein